MNVWLFPWMYDSFHDCITLSVNIWFFLCSYDSFHEHIWRFSCDSVRHWIWWLFLFFWNKNVHYSSPNSANMFYFSKNDDAFTAHIQCYHRIFTLGFIVHHYIFTQCAASESVCWQWAEDWTRVESDGCLGALMLVLWSTKYLRNLHSSNS